MTCNNNIIGYNSLPWIEKYRPRKLDDIAQSNNLMDLFKNNIKTGNMTHYLFYGPPGTGKTSAILAIGREIFKQYHLTRIIEFNASDDRGINAVREKITNEAKKSVSEIICEDGTIIPPYKIIILDEADSMTDEAQDALRVIIEEYSTVTRFCFICNYISKITDAIKSRCSKVYFKKLSDSCMVAKLNDIATKESMILKKNILNVIIDVSNGDMRKAIMLLQNLKYLYNYKNNMKQPLGSMSIFEANKIYSLNIELNTEISEADIYDIAATISVSDALIIVENILTHSSIVQLTKTSKAIIARGYPIDNILLQLNKAVLQTNKLNDQQKSQIINYSGKIFYRMKECSNEYIQLTDYMACIYGIYKGIGVYQ